MTNTCRKLREKKIHPHTITIIINDLNTKNKNIIRFMDIFKSNHQTLFICVCVYYISYKICIKRTIKSDKKKQRTDKTLYCFIILFWVKHYYYSPYNLYKWWCWWWWWWLPRYDLTQKKMNILFQSSV